MLPKLRPVGIYVGPQPKLWKKRVTWFLLGNAATVVFQTLKAWFYVHCHRRREKSPFGRFKDSPWVSEGEGVRFTDVDFGTGLFGTVGQAVFPLPTIRRLSDRFFLFPYTVGVSFDVDDLGVMGQPIDQGPGESVVVEDFSPVFEGAIGG